MNWPKKKYPHPSELSRMWNIAAGSKGYWKMRVGSDDNNDQALKKHLEIYQEKLDNIINYRNSMTITIPDVMETTQQLTFKKIPTKIYYRWVLYWYTFLKDLIKIEGHKERLEYIELNCIENNRDLYHFCKTFHDEQREQEKNKKEKKEELRFIDLI